MDVSLLWLIYILTVLIVYFLLSICSMKIKFDMITKLFLALIVALIVVLFSIPHITPHGSSEKTWYSILLLVAFLAPLAIALWLIWTRNRGQVLTMLGIEDGDVRQFDCDNDQCVLRKETRRNNGTREVYNYK